MLSRLVFPLASTGSDRTSSDVAERSTLISGSGVHSGKHPSWVVSRHSAEQRASVLTASSRMGWCEGEHIVVRYRCSGQERELRYSAAWWAMYESRPTSS